jgi:hypothetical protein
LLHQPTSAASAAPASVTPLPTAYEGPGWWSKPPATQPSAAPVELDEPLTNGGVSSGGVSNGDSADLDSRVTTADLGDLGLPVRVRQASLAPQLRDSRRPGADSPAGAAPQASAEAARSTMAALQRGWELGRSSASLPSDAGPAASSPADEDAHDGDDQ